MNGGRNDGIQNDQEVTNDTGMKFDNNNNGNPNTPSGSIPPPPPSPPSWATNTTKTTTINVPKLKLDKFPSVLAPGIPIGKQSKGKGKNGNRKKNNRRGGNKNNNNLIMNSNGNSKKELVPMGPFPVVSPGKLFESINFRSRFEIWPRCVVNFCHRPRFSRWIFEKNVKYF